MLISKSTFRLITYTKALSNYSNLFKDSLLIATKCTLYAECFKINNNNII